MKWKAILFFLFVSIATSTMLRDPSKVNQLDANSVKSPGGFENVAPDAKAIVTPSYAQPKVDVNLKVRTTGLVQRTQEIGTTQLPKVAKVFNAETNLFDTVPVVENKKIVATTTAWAPTDTFQTVQLDMQSGKVIPPLNNANLPKASHGI